MTEVAGPKRSYDSSDSDLSPALKPSRRTLLAASASIVASSSVVSCYAMPVSVAEPGAIPGLDLSGIDPKIRPQDDFYSYVNGTWMTKTTIPADKSRYGAAGIVQAKNCARIRRIIDAIDAPSGDDARLKKFYTSIVDTAAIEAYSSHVLDPLFAQVDAARTKSDLLFTIGTLVRDYFFDFPFSCAVEPDANEPSKNIFVIYPSGLGLCAELLTEAQFGKTRDDYQHYLQTIHGYAGLPDTLAQEVLEVEVLLAQKIPSHEVLYDAQQSYHYFSLVDFLRFIPGLNLMRFIAGMRIPVDSFQRCVIRTPELYQVLARIWSEKDLSFLQQWVKGNLVRQNTDFLSTKYQEAHFAFYSRQLAGIDKEPPRWQTAVHSCVKLLPNAVDRLFARQYVSAGVRDQINEIVHDLKRAYRISMERSWLTSATKQAAIAKLDA